MKKSHLLISLFVIGILVFSTIVSAGWLDELVGTNPIIIIPNQNQGSAWLSNVGDPTNVITGNVVWKDSGDSITTTANVGIGTTTPKSLLHIDGGGNSASLIVNTNKVAGQADITLDTANSGSANSNIGFREGGVAKAMIVYRADVEDLGFRTGGTAVGNIRMTIASSGNVGIGTTNPSNTLTVVGSGDDTGLSLVNSAGTLLMRLSEEAVDDGRLLIFQGGTSGAVIQISGRATHNTYFNNGGNFGIGTTNPKYKLDVVGTINAQNVLINGQPISGGGGSSLWLSGSNGIYYNTGKVGIGRTSPAVALDVNGRIFSRNVGTQEARLALWQGGVREWSILNEDKTGKLQFATGTGGVNKKVTIDSSGKVGIGTTNPIEELHIESAHPRLAFTETDQTGNEGWSIGMSGGDFYFIDDPLSGGAANSRLVIQDETGNVGIGTIKPKKKLHIIGDLYIQSGQIIVQSSDGTCRSCGPDNKDNWVCNPVQCP